MSKQLDREKILDSYTRARADWENFPEDDLWAKGYLHAIRDLLFDIYRGYFDVE